MINAVNWKIREIKMYQKSSVLQYIEAIHVGYLTRFKGVVNV